MRTARFSGRLGGCLSKEGVCLEGVCLGCVSGGVCQGCVSKGCLPGGCLPRVCVSGGVCLEGGGGCLPRGVCVFRRGVSAGGGFVQGVSAWGCWCAPISADTPPGHTHIHPLHAGIHPPPVWTESQTGVKTLPSRNFVCGR